MLLSNQRPGPPSSEVALADWFDPAEVPVTVVAEDCRGSAWERVRVRLSEAIASGSLVTLCIAPDSPCDAPRDLFDALTDSGLNCSRIRIADASLLRPDVLPRTPLLAPEYACFPWSERELMCPAETAWIPMELSLLPFAKDFRRLGATLDAMVDRAEKAHDDMHWPTTKMRHDAHLNRRVAIELLDVGCYAASRSPSEMHRCVGWISARLQARSTYWARRRGPLPSICAADPSRRMPASPQREQWRSRWQRALLTQSVRHRNLLALSPWSILSAQHPERFELLSLLVHADVVCLAAPRGTPPPRAQLRRLVEHRTRVALQQRQALDQIAKHI